MTSTHSPHPPTGRVGHRPETQSAGRPRAAGFTLLEVLTVVGIIAALTGIVAVAFSVVGSNAAARQTRASLEICLSLQGEYETAVSLPVSLKQAAVSAADLDQGVSPGLDPTARLAILVRTMPKNEETEGQLSAAAVESLVWKPATWVTGSYYAKGDYVTYPAGSTNYFTAINAFTAPAPSASSPPSDTTNWAAAALPSPILVPKDGWGHGMRFVGSALTNLTIAGGNGKQTPRANVSAPAGRPFWVSAGPDGLFTTHDDNVYSFEN